jgi:uncharacterized repeat protein (TIGR01451 family)/LPXTG-motif cell wall-anchored protein
VLSNVVVADDKCAPLVLVSGDTANLGKLDPSETWRYTCTPNPALAQTTTNLVTATGTDDEGNVAKDTATAVVVVLTPSINVDKTSNTSSIVPGDAVTYSYVVTNTGNAVLSNVVVADDKCSPVTYVSGDTNGDGQLQLSETWVYTCTQVQTGSIDTLTNTATAKGTDAIGASVTASDTVSVSAVLPEVIVRAPELPRTGVDVAGWLQLGGSLVLLGFALLVVSRRPATAR